jgi:UDP-glucose:(heptosyl)LPS alpha-1,3-glucosyltransferase
MARIALLSDRLDPALGGGPRWVSALAAQLAGAGHEVHLVSFDRGPLDLPGRHHALPDPLWPAARARALAPVLARIAPERVWSGGVGLGADVLQPQTGSEAWSLARFIAAMPPARRLRATLQPRTIARRIAMARFERRQCAAAGQIVAISERVREVLVARCSADPARIVVVPNGVAPDGFAPARLGGLRGASRAAFGAGDAVLFLLAGHNLRLKGAAAALRALALLRGAAADARLQGGAAEARLLLAGGPPDDGLRRLAARLLPAEAVCFAGPVTDMAPCYAAADALVHPARWDAFGLVVAEAMAAGLPVIASTDTGAAAHLAEGRSGFIVAAEDVRGLAARMALLCEAPRRRAMGEAARAASGALGLAANLAAVAALIAAPPQSLACTLT